MQVGQTITCRKGSKEAHTTGMHTYHTSYPYIICSITIYLLLNGLVCNKSIHHRHQLLTSMPSTGLNQIRSFFRLLRRVCVAWQIRDFPFADTGVARWGTFPQPHSNPNTILAVWLKSSPSTSLAEGTMLL